MDEKELVTKILSLIDDHDRPVEFFRYHDGYGCHITGDEYGNNPLGEGKTIFEAFDDVLKSLKEK